MSNISNWLANDTYKPENLKESLAQWDNYQIYTLMCLDYPIDYEIYRTSPNTFGHDTGDIYSGRSDSTWDLKAYADYRFSQVELMNAFVAVQTYNVSTIPINFIEISQNCIVRQHNIYAYITYQIQRGIRTHSGYITNGYSPQYDFSLFQQESNLAYPSPIDYEAEPFNFIDLTTIYGSEVGAVNSGITYINRTHSVGQITYQHHDLKAECPNYSDLIGNYLADKRIRPPDNPVITLSKSGKVNIGYYHRNQYEPIPNLISIDWMEYTVEIERGKLVSLPIIDPVFGTLVISGSDELVTEIQDKLSEISLPVDRYSYIYYLYSGSTPAVWTEWITIYNSVVLPPKPVGITNFAKRDYLEYSQPIFRVLAANNNVWDNTTLSINDLNIDINHPMFKVDENRTFRYHFKIQSDNSYGNLTMDSPKLVEIHKALDAQKYSRNELDPTLPRVSNLGWHINRQSEVIGVRVDANGKINVELEKTKTRHLVKPDEQIDQTKYGGTSFGSEGMLVRRLPNYFDNNSIKSGGIVGIHDLTQLMLEILDQLNLAIGLQESGAIEINHGGTVHRYPSLLALVTEIAVHQFTQSSYAKSTHISSLVTQEQTKEIIGGLGLPTVSKTLLRTANGNKAAIPYWGIAPQASLAKRIDTCTYNVGVVLGQLI
jgi:hypothetical protein